MKKSIIFALATVALTATAQADDLKTQGIHRTEAVNISDHTVKTQGVDGIPTLTKVCVDGYAYLVLNVGRWDKASGHIVQMRRRSAAGSERLVTCEVNEKDELKFN